VKILAKLLMGFITVALLCLLVGVAGVVVATRLSSSVSQLSQETIPTIELLYQINEQMVAIKVAIRTISNPLGADDTVFIKRQKDNIADARTKYADLIAKFDALPKTPEEKLLWEGVKGEIPTVKAYNDELVGLAEKALSVADPEERAGIYQEIYIMISGDRRLVFDNFLAKVQKVIDYDNQYYGGELPKQAEAFGKVGKAGLVIVSLSAVIAAVILGIFMGLSISKKIKAAVAAVDRMAAGDLSERLEVKSKDEFLQLAKSTNACMDNIQALIADAGGLVDSALAGRLATRADASKHQGDYRRIVEGFNQTLDAVIGPLNMAASCVEQISKGEIPSTIIDEYNGDFNLIKNNLNLCIESINALVADAGLLVDAAVSGRLSTRADAGRHQGDYRKIIEGVNRTLDLVIAPITETSEVLKHVAEGDLTVAMAGAYKGDFEALKTALNGSVDSINEILTQVTGAVEQVSAGALQVSQASQALSQGATEQAASLEEITSSITEVSGQTRQNTENAQTVFGLSKTSRESAEQGNIQMRDLVAAMSDINKSAEEIRKIVKAIDDISFQINLLALNANVEAARAGKYGKGFAVVAEEVRNLAVRSANSVKETTRMVDEAIANIERGNGLVGVTAKQLESIVEGAGKVASLAEDVSGASREQALGLEQISTGLNQIDQVTQSNTASAEESAAAAEELSSQSQQLKATLRRFRLKEVAGKVSNAEVLQLLRAELARQSGHGGARASLEGLVGVAEAAGAQAQAGAVHQAGGHRPARAGGVNPSDLISLDDDNFGKF
jgi:methyl-accepting chemotaxis protein